ncbi:hypothetical protein I4U23_025238 [Adineta vaga]|nr:hypothetical protein I4U23_025238 [Adineta vaga]
MAQFIPMFNITSYIFTLFILFIFLNHSRQISAYSIDRVNNYASQPLIFDDDRGRFNILSENDGSFYASLDDDDDDDLSSTNLWQKRIYPNYYRPSPIFKLHNAIVRVRPYKKRTIPLELQKALYAHGIVGRRR